LNSLFREIVFPVPRNCIPCSTKLNSLFRAKKFPVNLTGNLPENPEFRRFSANPDRKALPKKSINREITPKTGNFCGKMHAPRSQSDTAASARFDRRTGARLRRGFGISFG
jgi:hypothetical protein